MTPIGSKPHRHVRQALALLLLLSAVAHAENIVFPPDSGIIDVTAEPYNAKGDGVTDDTEAIQAALGDYPNAGAIIYLPNGTYLISKTLTWPHGNRGGMEEKNTILQGQSREGTVLKLKDRCPDFGDPKQHRGMIWTGTRPAQRFRNAVRNLTFDTGSGNPGACGMHFMANNQGGVRDVTIRSGDGKGAVGLDLGYTDENGPCLIRNVCVIGFDIGIRTATAVDSETFEHITLENQNVVGFENDGQCVSIRGLTSTGSVPAVRNKAGSSFMTLIDARLNGRGAASGNAAIINGAAMLARNVKTTGYGRAIRSEDGQAPGGADVGEYVSHPVLSLFESPKRTLGLPVKETPDVPWDALQDWVSPLEFGATGKGGEDITQALQKAIDSGKTTVYIPRGGYRITDTVLVRGKVRRLIGCEPWIDAAGMDKPAFKVVDGEAPVVRIERLSGGYAKTTFIEHASRRTLVIASCCNTNCHLTGGGELFLEDICSNPFNAFVFNGGKVWARQFNVENQGTHVVNNGAALWILGLKTERGGTLIETRAGGRTEVLGGFCYTTTAGKLAPMFVCDGGAMTVSVGESCFSGDPYVSLVREKRGGETKELKKGQAPGRTGGSMLVLYSGYAAAGAAK